MKAKICGPGAGQHACNGQVERAVQTIRRMANGLGWHAEDKARINIWGTLGISPFLINRFRVIDGTNRTNLELATGHP